MALNGEPYVFRCEHDWVVKYNGQQIGKIIVNDDGMFYFSGPKITSRLYDKFTDLNADIPDLVE